MGVMGFFPTCVNTGPAGFVSHGPTVTAYFGPSVDFETEGNAGNCPNFPPYDADECWNDGDAGLLIPPAFTIDPLLNYVPCDPTQSGTLGLTCNQAFWGQNIDIQVVNNSQLDRYVNVLFDWDQNGQWTGASVCPNGPAPEHVLVNFLVPPGFVGPLSALSPPPFMIGPKDQFVWSRFTISDVPVAANWDGSGSFDDGETCDYLLFVERDLTGVEESDAPVMAPSRIMAR